MRPIELRRPIQDGSGSAPGDRGPDATVSDASLIARENLGAHLDLHDVESPEHVSDEPAKSTGPRDASDEARFSRFLDVLGRPRGLVRRPLGREGKARR
jgi:uncharacterized protein YbjT (DUF2867 family)